MWLSRTLAAVGWADMTASTDFLVGIVTNVEEAIDYSGVDDDDRAELSDLIDVHELADQAVPTYNRDRLRVYIELDPYGQEEIDPEGFGVSSSDTATEVIGRLLYGWSAACAAALIQELSEA